MWSVEALILFSLLLIYVIFIKFVMHLFRCCEFIMQMVTFNTVFVNVAYIFTMVFLDCVRVSKILVIWIIQYIYTLIMKHVDDQFSFFWISLSDLMCWKQNHFFFIRIHVAAYISWFSRSCFKISLIYHDCGEPIFSRMGWLFERSNFISLSVLQ